MADDELDEEFDPDAIEEDLDEDALEEDVLEEDLAEDELVDDDDDAADVVVVVEDDAVEETTTRAKKRRDDEDDDDEEVDPDDVEADLDTILKDRIAAADEEEDEELDEELPKATVDAPDGVVPKRANEFMCTGCFLLVNRGQFGPDDDLQCPVGESVCPAIEVLTSGGAPVAPLKPAAKVGKATRKR